MEEPCICDCGELFELSDGYISIQRPNIIICKNCHEEESKILEVVEAIENLQDSMELGYPKKREGKKQLRELKDEYKRLTGVSYED